jgi:hypothetical protein
MAATITASADGRSATATVRVKNSQTPYTWNFRSDVIPCDQGGCNQGACHGALSGKNGLKLTLRGYDPDLDYDTLTRQSVGRRIDPEEPARSLMLLKPTMMVPHGGGRRFDSKSLEYKILSGWIAEGMPRPRDDDAQVTSLEVLPAAARLAPGAEQQLIVRAKYSDGQVRDVTRWVKFSSSDEGVASVDDLGHVKMNGTGEAAVTLYYSSRVLYARVTVPYANKVDAALTEISATITLTIWFSTSSRRSI